MPLLGDWEKAEIHRSSVEARLRVGNELVAHPQNISRYLDPPATTPYPLEYAFHLLGNVRSKCVLELGCGAGENTILFAARGANVIGLDISADLIGIAHKRMQINNSKAYFIVASAYSTGLKDESVDAVAAIAVLHHLDLSLAKKEICRVLKPGGMVIVQEPIRDSRVVSFVRKLIPYQAPDVSPYERPLRTEELNWFRQGFVSSEIRRFRLPFVSVIEITAPWLASCGYRADGRILRCLPSLGYYATIGVMRLVKTQRPKLDSAAYGILKARDGAT